MENIIDLLEALTIFCFGLSWPISIRKSWVSRTAKGKSVLFEIILLVGYGIGIARKVIQATCMDASGFLFGLSFAFYIINSIAISIDIALYFRNRKLDEQREQAEKAQAKA